MNKDITENLSGYTGDEVYISETPKNNCYICGLKSENKLLEYSGEDNIALINLNTFECYKIQINSYDEEKNLIAEAKRYPNSIYNYGSKEYGSTINYTCNSNKGYVSGTINLYQNSKLTTEKVKLFLCSECLNTVMKEYYYKDDHWDMAFLDCKVKQSNQLVVLAEVLIYIETFKNMLIELYAMMAQAKVEKRKNDSVKELLPKRSEESGMIMAGQGYYIMHIMKKPWKKGMVE